MKILLVNGSPHPAGTTFAALQQVAGGLDEGGVESEVLQLGTKPVHGCIACRKCRDTQRCVFGDDIANTIIEKMQGCDGLVLGSPVYYAGPNGAFCAVLDRAFFAGSASFAHKPGAAVAVCRRAGTSATLDRLNKYFTICQMPLISSRYWSLGHGTSAEEFLQDEEGVNTLRTLGRNMAYWLQSREKAALPPPEHGPKTFTNFIR